MEIPAHHGGADVERSDQNPFDESFRGHRREHGVETETDQAVHAQRFDDGLQRGGALRRQVTLHPPRTMQRQVEAQPPVREPAIIIGIGAGAAALHFPGQPGEVRQE